MNNTKRTNSLNLDNAATILGGADRRAGLPPRTVTSLMSAIDAPELPAARERAIVAAYARAFFA